jgi:hypothetical protein
MKLTVSLYRVTTIRTAELLAAAGLEQDSNINSPWMSLIKDAFKPFPPRFKIFYPADPKAAKTVVGVEAMSFDITEVNVPMAGLVTADPMSPQDVDRLDGGIESELNRMGISTGFERYEWRIAYEVKGN